MMMWIILGSLIGIVIIFLVVASMLDRKKAKRVKLEKAKLAKEIADAGGNIAIWVNITNDQNAKLLREFVPSIGELKMSDIRDRAKTSMDAIAHRKEFKLAQQAPENEKVMFHFKELREQNSNTWETKGKESLEFFKNLESKLDVEQYKHFKEFSLKAVSAIYKGEALPVFVPANAPVLTEKELKAAQKAETKKLNEAIKEKAEKEKEAIKAKKKQQDAKIKAQRAKEKAMRK